MGVRRTPSIAHPEYTPLAIALGHRLNVKSLLVCDIQLHKGSNLQIMSPTAGRENCDVAEHGMIAPAHTAVNVQVSPLSLYRC